MKAVRSGDLHDTEKFLKDHPEAVNAKITSIGETALHIAAMFGHLDIVKKLVPLMSEDDLQLKNNCGDAALHYACFSNNKNNNVKAVKCMVEKNKKLLTLTDLSGRIPVTKAFVFGQAEMGRYLYSVNPCVVLQLENEKHAAELLKLSYYSKMFGKSW